MGRAECSRCVLIVERENYSTPQVGSWCQRERMVDQKPGSLPREQRKVRLEAVCSRLLHLRRSRARAAPVALQRVVQAIENAGVVQW